MTAPLSATVEGEVAAWHLVVSEVMPGGASASDEFIELYNPGPLELPLEGLEVVYVSAAGLTVARKAAWAAGAPGVPAGAHVLIANEAGVFASIADATYVNGLAASGGSVALRVQGASTAIDAVGWGTAGSPWLEAPPAPAPGPGQSLERLPGGASGSGKDTDRNVDDFVIREPPDAQNSTSPPVPAPTVSATATDETPGASPLPTATPTASTWPTPAHTSSPTPTASAIPWPIPSFTSSPSPSASVPLAPPIAIGEARALPDGTTVTIRGVALTGSTFSDGGGYVADDSGGIAVLVGDGSFPRGAAVTVTGELDDRFSQRTMRASAAGVTVAGTAHEPQPSSVATGDVDEAVEGELVVIGGAVAGPPTSLSSGLAFDVDDGTGPARVLVGVASGIDTAGWSRGTSLQVVGVVGQRDSTGTGTAGYRVQLRDAADVRSVEQPTPSATPAPSGSASPSGSTVPSATPAPTPSVRPIASIAEARAAASNTRWRVRGVVTASSGLIDPTSGVVQDGSGAIMVRLGEEAGTLRRAELVEVEGTRSTKSGMLTLRVTQRPTRLAGGQQDPAAPPRATGSVGESDEALLVTVRGEVVAAPRRSSAGNLFFSINDGTGPLAVFVFASAGVASGPLVSGAWLEVRGIVGQETSTSQPQHGYRIWPRDSGDVRVLAVPPDLGSDDDGTTGSRMEGDRSGRGAPAGLAALLPGAVSRGAGEGVEATLVAAAWPELGVAGVLWDGSHAVGIADGAEADRAVRKVGGAALPAAVRVTSEPAVGRLAEVNLPLLSIDAPAMLAPSAARLADPLTELPGGDEAAWVRLMGRLGRAVDGRLALETAGGPVEIDVRCDRHQPEAFAVRDVVVAEGLAGRGLPRLVVPCGGLRAAPALSAPSSGAVTRLRRTPSVEENAPSEARATEERLLVPALLLLAAGTVVLGAAGFVTWRRRLLARLAGTLVVGQSSLTEAEEGTAADDRVDGDTPRPLELVRLSGDPPPPPR